MCSARNHTTHWHTRPEKNKMIWFRPSVGETRPCTSVQHGATETVSTYWNAFVCSAVVGRVCQCQISAKYGCSVTTAYKSVTLAIPPKINYWLKQIHPNLSNIKLKHFIKLKLTITVYVQNFFLIIFTARKCFRRHFSEFWTIKSKRKWR